MSETPDRPDGQDPEQVKQQERAEERALFARYQADPENAALEEQLVAKYTPLVYRIVHRFKYSPDHFNDLVQVGSMGLVHAIRRFDISKGFAFSTFAWQTIQGEIQRYFRDKTWAVNVPRDLKERSLKVFNVKEELLRSLGHDPTVAELAKACDFTEEQVQEAMELGSAYHPQSFSPNVRDADASFAASEDSPMNEAVDMATTKRSIFWESLLSQLDPEESRTLKLYFFEQRTQKEIAEELSTSQMNVSRLMRKALGKLQQLVAPEDIENLGML